MRLTSLCLEQYRNYGKLTIDLPEDDLHLLVGQNGSGKTNILEAISLLSLTKSFLGLEEDDLRQWGTQFYRVQATAKTDGGQEHTLEVVSQCAPRRIKACFHNGVRTPTAHMVGLLPVTAFLPQDLSLFSGPPGERRRMLDQLLCQVSPEYFRALLEYQKILKQRNALLRENGDEEALRVWDEALVEQGSVLICLRLELVETFNLTLREEVRALGEEWEDACVIYSTAAAGRERPVIKADLLLAFLQAREKDRILQTTTVGPHRDDWMVMVDGRPLFSFASRGQQRVAVLALLFLAASYLEVRRGEKPIILLDDIFSELDAHHRKRLLAAFSGHQVFLTATEVPVEGAFPGAVSDVSGGVVHSRHG
jgi:DNA replication and repair protein RecF